MVILMIKEKSDYIKGLNDVLKILAKYICGLLNDNRFAAVNA